jgi:hypothetical protein
MIRPLKKAQEPASAKKTRPLFQHVVESFEGENEDQQNLRRLRHHFAPRRRQLAPTVPVVTAAWSRIAVALRPAVH